MQHLSKSKIRLTHIITGLETGGAEMMLYKLLSSMDRCIFENNVISLTSIGPIGLKIQELGISVNALGMPRKIPNPLAIAKLTMWLQRMQPDVIQTWMYHADLLGGITGKLARSIPTVWGIRHSFLDPQASKRSTIWTAKICARLSHHIPKQIICCSEASRLSHSAMGYDADKMIVIPNGFAISKFRPDIVARSAVRREIGVSEKMLLIGLVARFDPQKDHHNFIQAAARFYAEHPNVQFLLCGDGNEWKNPQLASWIDGVGLRDHFHLVGRRQDMPRLFASLDIATSSSFSEGFPNVIGEAMACGVPCVVTDVGDSALLVGDTGKVVPPRNSPALASAWRGLVDLGEAAMNKLGSQARARIVDNYSLPVIANQYETLYQGMAQ